MRILLLIIAIFASLVPAVSARVDSAIRDRVKDELEEKSFILRVPLKGEVNSFGSCRIATDLSDFLYEDGIPPIFAEKGEEVVVDNVDFKAKEIELDLIFANDREAELTFETGRLSDDFKEQNAFFSRFDQIFMKEELKEDALNTDKIKGNIELGAIFIGMPYRELVLTLGEPHDIFSEVSADGSKEFCKYLEAQSTYTFVFHEKILKKWYEERN